jgi:hypothetical protein
MADHTPGPWRDMTSRPDGEDNASIQAPDGTEIVDGCGCCGSPSIRPPDRVLIAAAPEMLAALRRARSLLDGIEGEARDEAHRAAIAADLAAIDSAIARAEGRG